MGGWRGSSEIRQVIAEASHETMLALPGVLRTERRSRISFIGKHREVSLKYTTGLHP